MQAILAQLRGVLTFLVILTNTLITIVPLLAVTLLKLLLPFKKMQTLCSAILVRLAENWVATNALILSLMHQIDWDVRGLERVSRRGWYLVVCNHQSWTDILVLQTIFSKKAPFLKFFLKQELIWVPIMGVAWWALDFPFMKRYSKEFLAKHPELKGKDIETTRKACEKFKEIPVSVMNFLEGTRYTPAKHDQQKSPYNHLLRPKSGGVAFVLSSMGGILHSMLDVTIVYGGNQFGFWDLMCGRVRKVTVQVTMREIPQTLGEGDYENDPVFREQFQAWVSDLWEEKDGLIDQIRAE
ncbi:Phospholipid/glycerol acyltransferase [gamma proteobacterium HdN1]|nr:Phospholipid/glycerol acyltransferase [gamma proteobacterium HdN1]